MLTAIRIKDHWAEQRLFTNRMIAASVVALMLISLVIGRLVQLQVIDYDYFSAQSQGNRIQLKPVSPTRGLIFDRYGAVLAENLPRYQLELTREQVLNVDDTLYGLVGLGLVDEANIDELRDLIGEHRSFEAVPVRQRLNEEEIARFAVNRQRFPGVEIQVRLARNYPRGPAVAHALGYTGGISAKEMENLDAADYAGTAVIGKVSIERTYEADLHGDVGHAEVLVNARGRVMENLGGDPAVPGQDLILTLDMEAQREAYEALAGRRGAVVAIDPTTGEILVFASSPAFDPNLISAGMSRQEYNALQNDIDLPLFNRALRGSYPPGSTIKPILALAALNYDLIDPQRKVLCRGYYSLPGRSHRYRDWKEHGLVDMHSAIEQSCDVYFYTMANDLGIDRMENFLRRFGLGAPTGIDMGGEKAGLVPSRAWKRATFDDPQDKTWYPGETVITAIGQGYMLATPLQLAQATAIIASRGKHYQTTLLRGFVDPVTGMAEYFEPTLIDDVGVTEERQWQRIIDAMRAVVSGRDGTARAAGLDAPFTMAGKSGTAQVFSVAQDEEYDATDIEERKRDHALFIAFAPVENPGIAVAVVVENGESGSRAAAPIARRVIETYLRDMSQ